MTSRDFILRILRGLLESLGQEKWRAEVDIEQRVQLLRLNLEEWTIEGDTSVIDQAIDPPKKIQSSVSQASRCSRIGKIGLDGSCPPSQALDLARR